MTNEKFIFLILLVIAGCVVGILVFVVAIVFDHATMKRNIAKMQKTIMVIASDTADLKAANAVRVQPPPKSVPKIEVNSPSSVYISLDAGKVDLVV